MSTNVYNRNIACIFGKSKMHYYEVVCFCVVNTYVN